MVESRHDVTMKPKMKVHRAAVIPTLLYASETWRVLQSDVQCLEAFHMSRLREIAGFSLFDRWTSSRVRAACDNQSSIADMIRSARLRWFGHVCRMSPDRDPHAHTFGTAPAGWTSPKTSGLGLRADGWNMSILALVPFISVDNVFVAEQHKMQWRVVLYLFITHVQQPQRVTEPLPYRR